jgi:Tol biopolymer transport system component
MACCAPRFLARASAAGGDEALYAVNADGGDFRQITHCCGECWSDGEAAWSPGGDRIAFSRAIVRAPRRALRVAIDVANADGGLADEIDAASAEAVKGLRAYGYS